MGSATLRHPPLPAPVQLGLVVVLLALAAAAWGLTGERMRGMDAGPGTDLGGLGWFIGAWVVMMAAMMLPAIAPAVLAHARRAGTRPLPATAGFAAGYLLAWAGAGLLGYALVEGVRSLGLGFLGWDEAGPYVAGAVILAAALYQITPLKRAYLRECREPPPAAGALRAGAAHGRSCVGCCWALMATLFALGVMSIAWMAFVAALIAAERLLPWPAVTSRGIAVVLAVLALAIAFAPTEVPALTIPGSMAM